MDSPRADTSLDLINFSKVNFRFEVEGGVYKELREVLQYSRVSRSFEIKDFVSLSYAYFLGISLSNYYYFLTICFSPILNIFSASVSPVRILSVCPI